MTDWKCCKLKDASLQIIDGDRGKNYPSQNELSNEGYCLFLSTKNVRKSGFDFTEKQFISKNKDNILRKGKLTKNDIVLTTRGTIGNLAFYNESVPFENIRINSGMVIIRPDEKILDPTFCYYVFRALINNLDNFISGSAQPQLPIKDLREIEINIPKILEQKAIAAVLCNLDSKIGLLHQQNKTLEAMAETLFRKWFVEETKLDGTVCLGEYAQNIRNNATVEELKQYSYYVGLEHIPRKCLALSEWGKTDDLESNKSIFNKHDILFGKLRSYFHKVVFAPIDGVCSTDIMVIRPRKAEWFSFCLIWFFSKEVVEHSDLSSSGTRMPRTSWEILSSYQIPKPDFEKIVEYDKIVRPMIEKITFNIIQIQKLKQFHNTLLPKLMTGEIKVKHE